MRMRRVEVEAIAGVEEAIEGDGPRLFRRVEVAGDPFEAIPLALSPFAVRGGRVEGFARAAPAVEGDGPRDQRAEDEAGDPFALVGRAVGLGLRGRVEVRPAP